MRPFFQAWCGPLQDGPMRPSVRLPLPAPVGPKAPLQPRDRFGGPRLPGEHLSLLAKSVARVVVVAPELVALAREGREFTVGIRQDRPPPVGDEPN